MDFKINPILTSFNGGETSPLTDGRVDAEAYYRSLSLCRNMIPHTLGPCEQRPGTKYIGTSIAGDPNRLFKFEYASGDSYIIEITASQIRFFTQGARLMDGGSPYAISSPYAEADLPYLRLRQVGDVCYFSCPNVAPYKLTRLGALSWTMTPVVFDWPPFLTENATDITISPSGTTGAITLKTGPDPIVNGLFASDLTGWTDVSDGGGSAVWAGGRARITGNGTTDYGWLEQQVTVLENTKYSLNFGIYNAAMDLVIGTSTKGSQIYGPTSQSTGTDKEITFTVPAGTTSIYIGFRNLSATYSEVDNVFLGPWVFDADHVGAYWKYTYDKFLAADLDAVSETVGPLWLNQGETITVSLSGTWVGTVTLQRKYGTGGTYIDYASWTANTTLEFNILENDVFYRLNMTARTSGICNARISKPNQSGYVKIATVASGREATATVIRDLPAENTESTRWAEGAFSDYQGYPAALSFYEQRLLWGSTTKRPSSIWASKVDDYENHETGASDANAYFYTLAGPRIEKIKWMIDSQILHIGTGGDEWKFGFIDEPTTPSNVRADRQSDVGSADIDGIMIGDSIFFVEGGAKGIRQIRYNLEADRYLAHRISDQAEHFFKAYTITDWTYVSKPVPIIWMVRSDGKLVSCTIISLEQSIFAFALHDFSGGTSPMAIAIASIEGTNRDELWAIFARIVNATPVQWVEQFQSPLWTDIKDAFYVDAGLTYSGAPTSSISGLDHLNTLTVSVFADGKVHPDCVVSGGSITLNYQASKVHVGIGYRGLMRPKRLEIRTDAGTSQGKKKTIHKVVVRVHNTLNCKAGADENNLQLALVRGTYTPLASPPVMFSGDIEIPYKSRNDNDGYIAIANDDPSPLTVLAIMPLANIGAL